MARERRVALGYHNEQSDEPGIAQQDDGNFDLIAPDGSRSELGAGGPAFNGGTITEALTIAPTDGDSEYGSALVLTNIADDPLAYLLVAKSVPEASELLTLSYRGALVLMPTTGTGARFSVDDSGKAIIVQASGSGRALTVTGAGATGDFQQTQLILDSASQELWSVSSDGSVVSSLRDAASRFVVRNGSATTFQVMPSGAYVTRAHAAPADGDLANGDCAVWFDQTNGVGNTKLMIKGKSADGTVKTAAITLV